MTLKASKCLQGSDVIVYDKLVSQAIIDALPSGKQLIYVGKAKGLHSATQSEINQLLLRHALAGKTVSRLKGGDSFVFGRGGEEMLELHQANIRVEVVPGITAASGCTSYAGIPLTHRGLSQGCSFITAHAEKSLEINWQALAALNQTLVFYMGLSKLELISQQLMTAGMSGSTPVAIIEKGCTDQQRVISGQLHNIHSRVATQSVQSPALIVVGQVVSLREQLDWFTPQSQQLPETSLLQQLSA
ncbi:uroporphyrinogen-III C-methyltransferase [Shewanella submarina]|uniref:uroporphyrinogen-III C-methyltransferase n=1 Tax=Shewanella submarina TaxID=2016376 RepID=A0ABV7GMF4_9GAMM